MSKENNQITLDLEPEALKEMLSDKQVELNEAILEISKLKEEIASLKVRSLKVHEKNQQLIASPEMALKIAEMDYHLKMADQFIKSKAFPNMTPEQAYTLIKAGQEMGMKEVESLQTLYIVNGAIKPYGDKMVGRILKHGYKIQYKDETKTSVTVRIYNEEIGFDETETVKADEQVLQNSKAMKFASKNKLRFHAVRMFASFHLAHLFLSITDTFTPDFQAWDEENKNQLRLDVVDFEKEKKRLLDHILEAEKNSSIDTLQQVRQFVNDFDLFDEYQRVESKLMN